MKDIKLINPDVHHKSIVADFIKEHTDNNEFEIHGGALIEKLEYEAWLNLLRNNSDKATVDKEWVISSTFLAIRKSDNKMIGIIDIRHELNDFLSSYGGHIGFDVRPRERGKGYATEMLRQALEFCRQIGLQKVMLTCYKENKASRKTIEKCGGVLKQEFIYCKDKDTDTIKKESGKTIQSFWITIL